MTGWVRDYSRRLLKKMSTEEVQEEMLCVNNSETSDIRGRKRKKEEDTEEDIERSLI